LQLVVRFQARELGVQVKHRGRNLQQLQWQVVGLAQQYMDNLHKQASAIISKAN
jgi:hypothetical protein